MGLGTLIVKESIANDALPIEGADVLIKNSDGQILHMLKTDASGQTQAIPLSAPDKMLTLSPDFKGTPYSTYNAEISCPGFVTEIINGIQIFDGVEAVEDVQMMPFVPGESPQDIINITPHKQTMTVPFDQQGPSELLAGRVLQRVVIPDFITVHLGKYSDAGARNIRVAFPLYIKNVASSEIYPTWPEASLEANIRAIINFALNRVYTEWYRIRDYNFDITSSTSNDMYFVEGRDIFTSISVIVDRIMGEYLRRPGHNEPYFTEF